MEDLEELGPLVGSRVSSRGTVRESGDLGRPSGPGGARERTPREKELDERILGLLAMAPRPLRRREIAKALGVDTITVRRRVESLTYRCGQIAEDEEHGILLSEK